MYNILICDDERDIVSALKIYLRSDDYRLFEAYNGREAVEIAKKNELHLVLCDIMMPELTGTVRSPSIAMEMITSSRAAPQRSLNFLMVPSFLRFKVR